MKEEAPRFDSSRKRNISLFRLSLTAVPTLPTVRCRNSVLFAYYSILSTLAFRQFEWSTLEETSFSLHVKQNGTKRATVAFTSRKKNVSFVVGNKNDCLSKQTTCHLFIVKKTK